MAIARIKIAGFSGNKYQAWKASIFFGGCCTSSAISMGHFPQPNQQRVCWSPDLLLRTAERKLRKLLPKGAKWRWRRPKILPGSSQWFIGLVVKSSKWGYSINNWGRTMVFFQQLRSVKWEDPEDCTANFNIMGRSWDVRWKPETWCVL